MGKLMHSPQIQHSSHHHLLHLAPNFQNQTCAGCNLHISAAAEQVYTCTPCNFYLHPSCSKFPDLITHPSHPGHTLTLLPTSIYPAGVFRCDACAQQGNRFSYHCHHCDFDLHVLCASKPLSVTHPSHVHPLLLTFSSPYGEKSGFACDLCSSIGSSQQWLYRCVACEFDVHLHCATAKTPPQPPPLLHHNSFPGAAPVTHPKQFMGPVATQPLIHSMSTGHVQSNWQPLQTPAPGAPQGYQHPSQPPAPVAVQNYQPPRPVGVQNYQHPPQPPAPVGVQNYQPPSQPPAPAVATQNVGPGNDLANTIMMGFVEGAVQQLGQNFVQSLTGGGGGGGGNDVANSDVQSSTYENYETNDL